MEERISSCAVQGVGHARLGIEQCLLRSINFFTFKYPLKFS